MHICRQRQREQAPPAAIMLRSLRKVFPARDGNAPKVNCSVGGSQAISCGHRLGVLHSRCGVLLVSALVHEARFPASLRNDTFTSVFRWRWLTCRWPSRAASALACWVPTAQVGSRACTVGHQ